MPQKRPAEPATAKLTRVAAGDGKVMPWKNGGGTTTELAVRPEGAALSSAAGPGAVLFDWRLSIATIDGDGPFSEMAGVERTILQLSGPELNLAHEGPTGEDVRRALRPGCPWCFAGEARTRSTKAEPQPARDFNVMVRRQFGAAPTGAHVWDLVPSVFEAGRGAWETTTRARTIACYAAAGVANVTVTAFGQTASLAPGELALWEGERAECVRVETKDAGTSRVIVIEIP
jgi:environmental stress-induced protein Ves